MMENEKQMEDRRPFDGPDGNMYYIAAPTAEDVRGADWNYHKVYTIALIENISTSAEMIGILMKRGIIGPEFEQRQRELSDILSEKIVALQSAKNMDERQRLAVDVANARQELFQWNQRLNGPMSNTCEQIADDARLEYLTSSIVQFENGDKVWDSYDTYLKENNQSLALRARFEVMLYLQGMESDFLDNTPEAIALKEVKEELQKNVIDAITEKADDQNNEKSESDTTDKNTSKKKSRKKNLEADEE